MGRLFSILKKHIKNFRYGTAFVALVIVVSLILSSFFVSPQGISAATSDWDLSTSSDYTYNNTKIRFTGGVAELKPAGTPGTDWIAASGGTDWTYRRTIEIDNSANGSTLSGYQISITLDTAALIAVSKMQADGSDIRFTDSDKTTLLKHNITSGINTASTNIKVQGPDVDPNQIESIYLYYGNSNATDTSFAPSSINGNTLYLKGDTGVLADGAADFSRANKEYLYINDNADFSMGDIDFEIGAWVYLTNKAGAQGIVTKYAGSDAKREYSLVYSAATDRFSFSVYADGTTGSANGVSADNLGSPSLNTWYFIRAWHSASGDTINIQINDGAIDSDAHVGGVFNGTAKFAVGANYEGLDQYWSGSIDSTYVTKTISSTAEATALYNSGVGQTSRTAQSASALSTFWTNCISWWDMNAESGTRYDMKGTNHLTAGALQLINATTLNGGFETAGGGGADVFANWTEATAGTSTVNDETVDVYAGSHACRIDIDASSNDASVTQTVLTTNRKYKLAFYAKGTDASTIMRVQSSSTVLLDQTLTTSYAQYTKYFTAPSTTLQFKRLSSASKSIYIDNVTLESIGPLAAAGIAAGEAQDANFGAKFTAANTETLSAASTAALQVSSSFTIAGWVYIDSASVNKGIMAKYSSTGDREFRLLVLIDNNVYFETGTGTYISNTDDLAVGGWYFVVAWFDGSDTSQHVQVNNGTATNNSTGVTAPTPSSNAFVVGGQITASAPMDGRIDNIGYWKRVLTAAEKTWLFNIGRGRQAAELGVAGMDGSDLKTSLVDFWDFDEVSGNRTGLQGTVLTDNNTVTQGQGVNYLEGVVAKITDQSGNTENFTQTTYTKRPGQITNYQNGKPMWRFDGVDDWVSNSTDLIGTGDATVFFVAKPIGWGGGSMGALFANGKFAVQLLNTNSRIQVTSDATTKAYSANSSISLNTIYIIVVTRTSAGVVNIRINGALSGSADQSSGTPAAATVASYIGNSSADNRGFDGYIGDVLVFNSVLSTTNRYAIENSLSAKYGVALSSVQSPTAGDEGTYYPTDSPSLLSNSAQGYSVLQGFSETLGSGSEGIIKYQVSLDNGSTWKWWNGSTWAATSTGVSESNTASTINTNISALSLLSSGTKQFKWRAYLTSAVGSETPRLDAVTLTYIWDTLAPPNPAATALDSAGGSIALTSGAWYNYPNPSFSWSAPADSAYTQNQEEASGIAGYYIYFGTDATAEPLTAGTYQTTTGYTVSQTLTSNTTYYLRAKTKDNAGNLADAAALFTYRYDPTAPAAPEYVNVSPVGCSTASAFTITWPAVTDNESGTSGYQYRLGSQGSVQAVSSNTLAAVPYQEGDNVIYIRTIDTAGNASSSWQTGVFCSTGIAYITDGPDSTVDVGSLSVTWTSSKATTGHVKVYETDQTTLAAEKLSDEYTLSHSLTVTSLKPGAD